MRILCINNDGGGFADYIEVEDGMTVGKLVDRQIGSGNAKNYLIRVNRQPCAPDQVLQENDRISITPTKIEGAVGYGLIEDRDLDRQQVHIGSRI